MKSRGDQRGFTLIEVLVALVVLSVAVVAVLQLFGGGLRLARASGDHLGATLLASAKLGELAFEPLEEGTAEGTEGEYRWTRRVTLDPQLLPYDPAAPERETVRLARVSVEVRWGKTRGLELVTLRAWGEGRGAAPAVPSPAAPGPSLPGSGSPSPAAPGPAGPRGRP